ncbi:hypothetical protein Q9L58_001700 [Maublancomyces gigas]|uniref:Mis18 domain-containing protein n=1 Tax=Discina gigas TaxID=1032678 RepID=A0ABR3GTI7_9PEZI
MATRSPHLGESSAREVSPFFSLPNEDGSNPHQEYFSDRSLQQYPPITLSCAKCERIIGDSSSFLFVTRQMGTVTLDRVVSVKVGFEGLKTSSEGEWDEFWNKNTLCIAALSFYHHGSDAPSLPIAATSEIYAQLNPSPEALTESIDRVETVCVVLREEQSIIIRELKKLGAVTGVDVDLEDGTNGERLYVRGSWKAQTQVPDSESDRVESTAQEKTKSGNKGRERDSWKAQTQVPDSESDRVESTAREKTKSGNKGRERDHKTMRRIELGGELVPQELKGKGRPGTRPGSAAARDIQTAPQRQGKESQRAPIATPPPPAAANKRKRKSDVAITGKQTDLTGEYDGTSSPLKPRFWHSLQREVPNSQSAGEEETRVEPVRERGGYEELEVSEEPTEEEEDEEDEEPEEEWIRSPAEKKRRGVVPVLRKEVLTKKSSHHKKGHK